MSSFERISWMMMVAACSSACALNSTTGDDGFDTEGGETFASSGDEPTQQSSSALSLAQPASLNSVGTTSAVTVVASKISCGGTFHVTREADRAQSCKPNDCSLREAVMAANACPGHDRIQIPEGRYFLTVGGSEGSAPNDRAGDLDITESVSIYGAGKGKTTIDGESRYGIFELHHTSGSTLLSGMTLQWGKGYGGALRALSGSQATLINVAMNLNSSNWFGGAIYAYQADLWMLWTDFGLNSANTAGGAIYADESSVWSYQSKFQLNSAAHGGAIYAESDTQAEQADVTLIDTKFVSNRAKSYPGWLPQGGAINLRNRNASIRDSSFTQNRADAGAGAVAASGTTLDVSNSTFSSNSTAKGSGGAMSLSNSFVEIDGSSFTNNRAFWWGGAIFTSATTTITGSSFERNRADGTPTQSSGGAIENWGILRLESSLLADNSATEAGGAVLSRDHGTIINSTLSENAAGLRGGAVAHEGGDIYLKNNTIVGNTAPDAAALYLHSSYPLVVNGADFPRALLNHNVVAHLAGGGTTPLCRDVHFEATGEHRLLSYGYNLLGDPSCNPGSDDLTEADPLLAPLADNGGPTRTHLPLASSPVLDGGATSTSSFDDEPGCAPVDQRGTSRPQPSVSGGTALCDIGAVEKTPATTVQIIGTVGSVGMLSGEAR